MTKLTNTVAIISKSGIAARLTAIGTESKTCIIYNGKEKVVKWSSAAEYKLDTGTEKTRTLTPKLLTALHDAETVHNTEEAPAETISEPEEVAQAEDAPAEETTAAAPDARDTAEPPKANRQRTPRGTLNDREKTFLSMIPALPDFKGVTSEMVSRPLIKKASELHSLPLDNARAVFVSLRNKGYYTAKGRESGLTLTTFTLTDLGVKYLTENNLLPINGAQAS